MFWGWLPSPGSLSLLNMAKKFTRKRTFRRRRSFKSRRGRSGMNRMQKAAYSYVKKKYTRVYPIRVEAGEDFATVTVSHIGGRNGTTPNDTLCVTSVNPDQMA